MLKVNKLIEFFCAILNNFNSAGIVKPFSKQQILDSSKLKE